MNAVAAATSTDEELLLAFCQGDDLAFGQLYARHQQGVRSYAWRLLRHREEAEEVGVEVWCKVVEVAHTWRPTGTVRAWLYTIAHRRCLDRLKRARRRDRALGVLRLGRPALPTTPEDDALGDESRRALELALAELPEEHRSTVLLYYGQELSSRETAAVLGCTDQQVRSRLSYARRRLRGILHQESRP